MENALSSPAVLVFNSRLKRNIEKAIESSDITLTSEEAEFILGIDEEDNPILRIFTLKKFRHENQIDFQLIKICFPKQFYATSVVNIKNVRHVRK